jgi:hypothetical protein
MFGPLNEALLGRRFASNDEVKDNASVPSFTTEKSLCQWDLKDCELLHNVS